MSVLSIEGEQEQLDTEVRHEAFRARKKFLIDASSIDWTPAENEKNEHV